MKINIMWIDDDKNPFIFKTPVEYDELAEAITRTIGCNGMLDLGINQYNKQRMVLFPKNLRKIELGGIDEV